MSTAPELNEESTQMDPSLNSSVEAPQDDVRELKKWTVILVGREPGVYFGTEGVMDNVHSIPGSIVVKFAEEADARLAYSTGIHAGKVKRVTLEHQRTTLVRRPDEESYLPPNDPETKTWRVVFVGREPGIFPDSAQIPSNVMYIPYGRSENFKSYERATSAYLGAMTAGLVVKVIWNMERETIGME